jgi:hypothetical protein
LAWLDDFFHIIRHQALVCNIDGHLDL